LRSASVTILTALGQRLRTAVFAGRDGALDRQPSCPATGRAC